MASVLVQVAEAVKAEIEAEADDFFSDYEFGAIERNYADFNLELTDLTPLRLDVVGVKHAETSLDTRGSFGYVVDVLVAVRQKFGQAEQDDDGRVDVAEVDRLVELVEMLHEFFCDREHLTAYSLATWKETTVQLTYSREHLTKRQFTGIVRVSYDVSKPKP